MDQLRDSSKSIRTKPTERPFLPELLYYVDCIMDSKVRTVACVDLPDPVSLQGICRGRTLEGLLQVRRREHEESPRWRGWTVRSFLSVGWIRGRILKLDLEMKF